MQIFIVITIKYKKEISMENIYYLIIFLFEILKKNIVNITYYFNLVYKIFYLAYMVFKVLRCITVEERLFI